MCAAGIPLMLVVIEAIGISPAILIWSIANMLFGFTTSRIALYAAIKPSEDDGDSGKEEVEDGSDEDVEAEHKCGPCICGPISHLPSPVRRALVESFALVRDPHLPKITINTKRQKHPTTATVASFGAPLLRKQLDETPAREALSKTRQSTSRKEGNDCPSTWSTSSTDVEHYLQRFRQDLMDQSKPPSIMSRQKKVIISEEEAETLTSLQTRACIARTISARSRDELGTEAHAESAECNGTTGFGVLLDDDTAWESATTSLQPTRRFLSKTRLQR
ncbi:hypothetical protein TSMEX_009600 [Taenia solium]|eukprot:TsM_000374300 transcript=TsM_000374300 gene=TsM_000374300